MHLVLQFGHETQFMRHCVLKQWFNSGFIIMQRFLAENQLQVFELHVQTFALCLHNKPVV